MLEKELQFYESHRAELMQKCYGRFALIKNDELIGAYPTEELALAEGARRFGLEPFMVREVTENEETIFIPSLSLGLINATSEHSS